MFLAGRIGSFGFRFGEKERRFVRTRVFLLYLESQFGGKDWKFGNFGFSAASGINFGEKTGDFEN